MKDIVFIKAFLIKTDYCESGRQGFSLFVLHILSTEEWSLLFFSVVDAF